MKAAIKAALERNGRIWTGPGRGLRLEGPTSSRVYLGLYEFEVNPWIRQLAQLHVKTFDVGAQYGFDAAVFARLTHAHVLTVEADAGLRDVLERNMHRNGLSHLVQPLIARVGDGNDGTVTLDQLAAKYFVPDFVKMDIEGAEADALKGSTETLDRCDRWLIETHGLEVENICLDVLAEHGFRVEIQNQRRWLPDLRPIDHNRWVIAHRSRH